MEQNKIYLRANSKDIALINKLFEAYEGLGVVTTLNAKAGLLVVHVTQDTKQDALEILRYLPVNVDVEL